MTPEHEALVENNLRLVSYVIGKNFSGVLAYHEFDDLFQIGCIGLIKAAEAFDPEKGCTFATFAYTVIFNEIAMYLRRPQVALESRIAATAVRLDKPVSDKVDAPLSNLLPDPRSFENTSVNFDIIWDVLDTTDAVSRMIWIGYRLEGDTQNHLAKRFNLSQAQISRKIEAVERRMRARLKP